MKPHAIEMRSMEIIKEELKLRGLLSAIPSERMPVVTRVIHATADFDFAQTLVFSPGVFDAIRSILDSSPVFVTDTNMIVAGINKAALSAVGGAARCYIAEPETV